MNSKHWKNNKFLQQESMQLVPATRSPASVYNLYKFLHHFGPIFYSKRDHEIRSGVQPSWSKEMRFCAFLLFSVFASVRKTHYLKCGNYWSEVQYNGFKKTILYLIGILFCSICIHCSTIKIVKKCRACYMSTENLWFN